MQQPSGQGTPFPMPPALHRESLPQGRFCIGCLDSVVATWVLGLVPSPIFAQSAVDNLALQLSPVDIHCVFPLQAMVELRASLTWLLSSLLPGLPTPELTSCCLSQASASATSSRSHLAAEVPGSTPQWPPTAQSQSHLPRPSMTEVTPTEHTVYATHSKAVHTV